jgi:hypothetical protein
VAVSLRSRGTFRANPGYELVLADHLTRAERHSHQLSDDLYGILRPIQGSGLAARSCPPDTALLFLTLVEPGPLPAFARCSQGEDGERFLARLVVDGVLEILTDKGFLSGPAAAGFVLPGRARCDPSTGGQGRIADLTVAALRYGQALAGVSAEVLASRLYLYGRRPVSPRLRSRMPNEAAVDEHLGINPGGAAVRALADGWREVPGPLGLLSPWRYWTPRSAVRRQSGPGHAPAGFKLYVSPAEQAMPAAVVAVAGTLAASPGVTGFKVARDLAGVCRPDKLVVYFDRLDDLRAGATQITQELAGAAAHGVPFTAAVTLDGLLSWAADPPPGLAARSSWRMWVAERLADYLIQASGRGGNAETGNGGEEMEPWQFALQRLRLAGVDTDTWVPASGIWRAALEMS